MDSLKGREQGQREGRQGERANYKQSQTTGRGGDCATTEQTQTESRKRARTAEGGCAKEGRRRRDGGTANATTRSPAPAHKQEEQTGQARLTPETERTEGECAREWASKQV
eukprot:1238757-Rhodomonas_salina.1